MGSARGNAAFDGRAKLENYEAMRLAKQAGIPLTEALDLIKRYTSEREVALRNRAPRQVTTADKSTFEITSELYKALRALITPAQIRGARAMLGLTQARLARQAGLSTTALQNIERGAVAARPSTLRSIRATLEAAGVVFVEENGEGPGVRLRKQRPADEGIRPEDLNATNDD
jgi:transcriptional regulator with XRE-family HTH domain